MLEVIDLQILQNINKEKINKNLDEIFQKLLSDIQAYLNLKPFYENVKVKIIESSNSNISDLRDIFSIGVNRYNHNGDLIIEINRNYYKFLYFILLREIYNLFIPIDLKDYEVVQIVVNEIIIIQLTKSPLLNDWRLLIRKHLEDYDQLSKGVTRLFESDRLEKFLKLQKGRNSKDPVCFFFRYLRENISIIDDKIDGIQELFFQEFFNYIIESENNDEIIETIRCLIEIFYNLKSYTKTLKYRDYFQKFKESGKIETDLSQRKFIASMDWIKKKSYIAPSYQLNWNAINISLISLFITFNPLLNKSRIYKVINQFPFFIAPKISHSSLAVDISGYIVIPNVYLNDFCKFMDKLEDYGYITKQYRLVFNKHDHLVNINYLRDYLKNYHIINPDHTQYDLKNEIEFTIDFDIKHNKNNLTLLDFLVLDRIRFVSVTGLGFERRNDMINGIKSDLLNEIIAERVQIKSLRKILKIFSESPDLTTDFLHFLEVNKKFGFFYIKKTLENSLNVIKIIQTALGNNPDIRSFAQLKHIIGTVQISQLIEDNLLMKINLENNVYFKEILADLFQSKKICTQKIERLKKFSKFINSCFKLKIFNIASIKKMLIDQKVINKIYKTKEAKLKDFYEKWRLYKITFQEIEKTIDKLLQHDPPIIKPLLINTILFNEKDYLQLILIDKKDTRSFIDKIRTYFPRVIINYTKDLKSNESLIYVEISTPYMTNEEKEQLYSILHNNLKNNILYGKSYLWKGWVPALSRKNFYDFNNKQFFYTKDLYKQFFLNVQHIFGDRIKSFPQKMDLSQEKFWSKERYFVRLIKGMNYRENKKNINLSSNLLSDLSNFNKSLSQYLLNPNIFATFKDQYFYKNCVKSIKFIPAFQHFGLEEFYIYVYPLDIESIDLKIFFSNTFQKVKYPSCLNGSNSLFIKYIMPYNFPNKKYINWLTKAKQIIREYIAFSVRKIHRIFQFHTNLDSDGWAYEPDNFKSYMQNNLLNPAYNELILKPQLFDLKEISKSKSFTPNSNEFKSLDEIYSWKSIDLKSYINANKHSIENHIKELIKKGLIFPYLSLKNLGIQDKVYIILPHLKRETIPILIKIFKFFNIGFIYEIEGEFFISGFDNEIKFQNGLMIKLYFPKCKLSEFEKLFDILFEYLDIKHYLILNDLINGSNLIKAIFGNLDFLETYNPLKNLKWNEKDKIWTNHNIFSKDEGFIYPDLNYNENELK